MIVKTKSKLICNCCVLHLEFFVLCSERQFSKNSAVLTFTNKQTYSELTSFSEMFWKLKKHAVFIV